MHVARLRKSRKNLVHNSWYFISCSDHYPAEDEVPATIIRPAVRYERRKNIVTNRNLAEGTVAISI